MSDIGLWFVTTVSRGLIETPNWSSKNVTTLSTANESSIPLVIRVVSVNPRGLPMRRIVEDECFHRSFYILRVHKRFPIRSAGQSLLIGYGFCRGDICCL